MTAPSSTLEFKLIDIREVWPGEARDFTPWLGDNLESRSDQFEIDELELVSTEVEVPGGRKLDILAKDADTSSWAIENQYGEADHDHLTRALAYAVGLECRAVIVVAESHRDEFVAVADEWNRFSEAYGSEGIRLFLVAIEAGRRGGSGPLFPLPPRRQTERMEVGDGNGTKAALRRRSTRVLVRSREGDAWEGRLVMADLHPQDPVVHSGRQQGAVRLQIRCEKELVPGRVED